MILLTSEYIFPNVQLQVHTYAAAMPESTTRIQIKIRKWILSISEQKSCCFCRDIEEKPFIFTWRHSYFFFDYINICLLNMGTNSRNISQNRRSSGWESHPGSPEYEARRHGDCFWAPYSGGTADTSAIRAVLLMVLWVHWHTARRMSHMVKKIARCYLWVYVKTKFLLIEFWKLLLQSVIY
jgi:hypothetical protein